MATDVIHELDIFLATNPRQRDLEEWMRKLTPAQYVECVSYLVNKGPTSFTRVLSPEHAYHSTESLSDVELFEKIAEALDDATDTSSGKIGLVDPRQNPEPISRFASLYNEAVRRGFRHEDIGFGMQLFLDKSIKLAKFGDPDWKRFEKLVARIHIALCRDADVKWSEKIVDKSGTERQLDVTIRTRTGPHDVLGIIQCKFEKRSVSIAEVESFISTKHDLNAGFAIMVSRSGYQSGAEAKARLHDIRLWTLNEAEQASWREETRTYELRYPMFDEITFSPAIPTDGLSPLPQPVDFKAVIISMADKNLTLESLIGQAIQNATDRCLPVPCWLDFSLERSKLLLSGRTFPLEKIGVHFSHYIIMAKQRKIKISQGKSYIFKPIAGRGLSISERELPALPNDNQGPQEKA